MDCEFDNENLQSAVQSGQGGGAAQMATSSLLAMSPGSAVGGDPPTAHRMDRFELRYFLCGLCVIVFRMERMENSIHDLIAALSENARGNVQSQQDSPPFPMSSRNQGNMNEEGDTDEDDNITRPTAGGTDDSEERSIPSFLTLRLDSPAPVEIIRGLASEFLDHQSPKVRKQYNIVGTGDDIVSKGIVSESQAQELLDMYPPFPISLHKS